MIIDQPHGAAPELAFDPQHLAIVRDAMYAAVNDGGTAGAARLYLPGIDISAKAGTAQVRRITMAERRTGVLNNAALPFKLRDHALFISFAPSDNPRYALAIVLEHNAHLIRNLDAPAIARDVFTYLFDRPRAITALDAAEKTWGGDIGTRMATQEATYRAAHAELIPAGTELDAAAPTSSDAVEQATAQADARAEAVANTAAGDSPAETGSPDAGSGGDAR